MLRYITFPGSSSKPMSPGEPGLFSEMVSVPTSGKQIKDERETFKNFLQAINLMPRVAEQQDTASTFSVSTRLRYIHVHQVDGGFDNLANKGKGSGKSRVGMEEKRKGRRQVSEEPKHCLYLLLSTTKPAQTDPLFSGSSSPYARHTRTAVLFPSTATPRATFKIP